MSDMLVHWAVFDDMRRIAAHDTSLLPVINEVMDEQVEFARLGALSRGGNKWIRHVLNQWRDGCNQDELAHRKLAFALGGIAHYAADVVMKKLMSEKARADWNEAHAAMQSSRGAKDGKPSIREVSAYYDTYVFRKVYMAGDEEPFNDFLCAANETGPGKALEAFVRSLFQRALLSSHTFAPDCEHIDNWFETLFSKIQPLYVDIELYTRVFANPDPAKMETYGVETDFYTDMDPVIKLARKVHAGSAATADVIESAIAEEVNTTGYGRSLALSMRRLRDASAFLAGMSDAEPDVKQ